MIKCLSVSPVSLARVVVTLGLALSTGFNAGPVLAEKAPKLRVLVDIAPVHSLVAQVMGDVGSPDLLLDGTQSPHNVSLRPSDARKLTQADLVVWTGPALTPWLSDPIRTLAPDARIIDFARLDGVSRLPLREGVGFSGEDQSHEHAHNHGQEDAHGNEDKHEDEDEPHAFDPHLWLDPQNAKALVGGVARVLAELDPENAATFLANATEAQAGLDTLKQQIADRLSDIRTVPFAVYHDAYHYFEDRFDLTAVAAVALSDGVTPGVRRIRELQSVLAEANIACIFAEPQFDAKILNALSQDITAKVAMLDPIGASIPSGAEHYQAMMSAMAQEMAMCLTPNG